MKNLIVGLTALLALAACSSPTPTPDPAPTPSATSSSAPAVQDCMTEQTSYCFGFGTYYVAMNRDVPRNWGNAKTWYVNAQRDGYEVGDTPKKGAIAWTDRGPFGQVAIVDDVLGGPAGKVLVTITEMNGEDGWNKLTTRTVSAGSFKYIYIFS